MTPKNVFRELLSLAHVPSANMEEAEFMSYAAASHQGASTMFWLHSWGKAVAHEVETVVL